MSVDVEEHPLQLECNQKIELVSNLESDNSHSNLCNSPKLFSNRFSCQHCDYSTINKTNLKKHTKTHIDENAHQCSHCDKCFAQKCRLVQHQKTHTGEKPYKCSQCDKCFAVKVTLARHQKTHTGEKPY